MKRHGGEISHNDEVVWVPHKRQVTRGLRVVTMKEEEEFQGVRRKDPDRGVDTVIEAKANVVQFGNTIQVTMESFSRPVVVSKEITVG